MERGSGVCLKWCLGVGVSGGLFFNSSIMEREETRKKKRT